MHQKGIENKKKFFVTVGIQTLTLHSSNHNNFREVLDVYCVVSNGMQLRFSVHHALNADVGTYVEACNKLCDVARW